MNTVEGIRAFAETQPDTRALVDMKTGASRTFAELVRDLDGIAAALRRAGVRPGDRTALFVSEPVALTTTMFACFQAGAVPVLIDPGMGLDNMLACVREQRPRVLIGVPKAHVLRTVARRAFASVEVPLVVGGAFPGARRLRAGSGGDAADAAVHAAAPADTAAILYTSGSTGPPKGVIYTHANFAGQPSAIAEMIDLRPGDVHVACFLPFGFIAVAMGLTAVFPDMDFRFPAKADPRKILAALEGARSAFASPALWEPFSLFLEREHVELPGLAQVLTAGAPVRPELHERLLAHLPAGDVFTPYGATEALPVSVMSGRAVVDETAALTRQGKGTCVGRIAPGVEVKILAVSDDAVQSIDGARELPRGEIGEIVVRGACVTRGYDNKPDANRLSKIPDGDTVWHRMGDVGYLDDAGRLWFCGRKAQRVETARGPLYSIPVEAVAEDGGRPRAALVGLGPRGRQAAVVVVERGRDAPEPAALGVHAALAYGDAFPVDRRHNAKIEREVLAAWAARRLPHLAGGVP